MKTGLQAVPWVAMSAVALAAVAARAVVNTSGGAAETAVTVAAVAFVAAVAAGVHTGRRIGDRRLRHRMVAALYLGASWVSAVAYLGISWGAMAALTIGGAALSLLYWRKHRIGPGIDPMAVDVGQAAEFVRRWKDNLGRPGRALAGARLAGAEAIRAGWRFDLELVPGVHTVWQVRSRTEALRSGLNLRPGQEVIVEEHPTRSSPVGLLTIVTRSPVKKPRIWPGPKDAFDSAAGSVNLGPFVDDEGVAQWTVYKRDGMFGGYLQGAPGSGKSRMIESIVCAVGASQTHPTVVWYGDGQGGSSSPMLAEHADFSAMTFESILDMLRAAVKVMQINAAENRRSGSVGFTPTPARPGLLVVVDECHKPLSPAENPSGAAEIQQLMATIAREGRKVGVALVLASQSPTLDAFGGRGNNADTLRASLLNGNAVILRSDTNNAKLVFGVDVNPRRFPKLPGYAYLARPEEGARSAPFRGYWLTDDQADLWPTLVTWLALPTRQANAAGRLYAGRHEVAQKQAYADDMLIKMADSGLVDDYALASGHEPAVVPYRQVNTVSRFWIPTPTNAAGLRPGQQKLLDALRSGHRRPGQLSDATGYSQSQVHNLLSELAQMGFVDKYGYGQYQAVA